MALETCHLGHEFGPGEVYHKGFIPLRLVTPPAVIPGRKGAGGVENTLKAIQDFQ